MALSFVVDEVARFSISHLAETHESISRASLLEGSRELAELQLQVDLQRSRRQSLDKQMHTRQKQNANTNSTNQIESLKEAGDHANASLGHRAQSKYY